MSTRSRIGILHPNGATDTIYCHCDGYPQHQMPILKEHYGTAEKVQALLALGDLSLLDARIAPDADEKHGFAYGERAEGYSFIVTGMLYSWVIDALIKAINEAFPDEDPLGTWRIQNGRLQVPCSGVKKEQYDTCMEIRLMWAHYKK